MTDAFPTSVATDTLDVLGFTLTVHVRDDGRRIIEKDGFDALLAAMETSGRTISPAEADALVRFSKGVRR